MPYIIWHDTEEVVLVNETKTTLLSFACRTGAIYGGQGVPLGTRRPARPRGGRSSCCTFAMLGFTCRCTTTKSQTRRATSHLHLKCEDNDNHNGIMITSEEPWLVNYSFVGASSRQQEAG